jgi:uncharacterized protein (DUF302 family)
MEEEMGMMDLMMNAMTSSLNPEDKQDTMLKMMPEMVKQIKKEDIMELMGGFMNKMMFITHKSKFDFPETIQRIKSNGEEHGWYNPIITNHYEIEQNFDLPEPNRVATISMCIPRSAYKILKENKKLAVMMPLQINVYEEDGQVYITWMNIEMLGKLFGETVSQVMKDASKGLMTVHRDILLEEGV